MRADFRDFGGGVGARLPQAADLLNRLLVVLALYATRKGSGKLKHLFLSFQDYCQGLPLGSLCLVCLNSTLVTFWNGLPSYRREGLKTGQDRKSTRLNSS